MRRYGVILALLAVTAAGCSEERAGSLPSASPMPTTATPSPTPTATVEAQVEAAARVYFEALERAGLTGDVAGLQAAIHPQCDCRKQIDAIRADAAAGRHATTVYRIEAVSPHDITATSASATVTFSSPASAVVDSAGRTVRSLPALEHAGIDLVFSKSGASWLVRRVIRLGA